VKKSVTAVVFIVFVVIFIALVIPKMVHVQKLEERSQALEEELNKIRVENKRMEMELRLLRDDPVYLEKVAREKFNKAKQGEIVYKVVRE